MKLKNIMQDSEEITKQLLSKEDLIYVSEYSIEKLGTKDKLGYYVEENWTRKYSFSHNPEVILFGLVEKTKIVTVFELFIETKIVEANINKILEEEIKNARRNTIIS